MKTADKILRAWRFTKGRSFVKGSCLDIGCHDGAFLASLPSGAHQGIDIKVPTKKYSDLSEVSLDSFKTDRTFDSITCFATYEHFELSAREEFWKVVREYLSVNGNLILTIPSAFVDSVLFVGKKMGVLSGMDDHQHKDVSISEMIEEARSNGLELVHFHKFQLGMNRLFVFSNRSSF